MIPDVPVILTHKGTGIIIAELQVIAKSLHYLMEGSRYCLEV